MIDPELVEDSQAVTTRMLRQFAVVWLLLFGGLALWNGYDGERGDALMFAAIGVTASLPGLIWPDAIRPLFSALVAITKPIGLVVTRLILGVMFYGVFSPIALLFKVVGRDALHRDRDHSGVTYWHRRRLDTHPRRYFRQY